MGNGGAHANGGAHSNGTNGTLNGVAAQLELAGLANGKPALPGAAAAGSSAQR